MSGKFFKNAGYLFVIELLVRVKALVALPLIAQSLGANGYGAWSQIAVVVATIIPFAVLGTDSAVMRYLPGKKFEDRARDFTAWMLLLCLTGLIGASALLCFHESVAELFFAGSPYAFSLVTLAGPLLCVSLIVNGLKNWFRLNDSARGWGLASGVQAGLNLVAIVLAISNGSGLIGIVLYSLAADCISMICLIVWIINKRGLASPNFSVLPNLIWFGLPLIPTGFAMWGMNYVDRVVIVRFGTLSDVGMYSVAYTLGCMLVQMIMSPIWSMYAPTAAALHNDGFENGIQKLFNQAAGTTLVIVLPVVAGLAVLGGPIISLVAGEGFEAGADVMWLVALGYVFSMMASYCEISLSLAFRQYYLTIAMGLAFFINLLLNIVLIPKYSIYGAAVATLSAFFAQFLLSAIAAHKLGLLSVSLRFPLRILLATIFMGLAVSIVNQHTKNYGLAGLAVDVIFGVLIYVAFTKILKIVPVHIERKVLGILRTKIGLQ